MRSVCKLHADDNSLLQCSDDISVMEDNLNDDLFIKYALWIVKQNGYYSSIHRKQKLYFLALEMLKNSPNWFVFGDCTLEYVSQHKHLGLMLSSNLGWSHHIDNIVKIDY